VPTIVAVLIAVTKCILLRPFIGGQQYFDCKRSAIQLVTAHSDTVHSFIIEDNTEILLGWTCGQG
jgi:hypothetical protein